MSIWALIVAIEDYPGVTSALAKNLPGTNSAAEAFRNWLLLSKRVPTTNILACVAPSCSWRTAGTTRQEIVDEIGKLVQRSRDVADELHFFFSGHGIGFAQDPYGPSINILIGSDFTEPTRSGAACIKFDELKERLRLALGPGKHFYFVDACRNPIDARYIDPISLGTVFGRSSRGNATTYVLFSTAPGDVARIDSGFSKALLDALRGVGRAKAWVGGKMFVTFDNLCAYIQRSLGKNDLDPEKRGPADGSIVQLDPLPTSNCTVEVMGAAAADAFTLRATDVRNGQRDPVTFQGSQKSISVPPDDYVLSLSNSAGLGIAQIDPPVSQGAVDLYDDRAVRFQIGLPANATEIPLVPMANLEIARNPGALVSLRHLASGKETVLQVGVGKVKWAVEPGLYRAHLKDGNFKLASRRFSVAPGETFEVDFSATVSPGAHASLSKAIPTDGPLIQFSETLHNVPDWDLSLWLAVLGSSRIVGAEGVFSKLQSIPLQAVSDATPGEAVLYVLSGEVGAGQAPTIGVGVRPTWMRMHAVAEVPGLFQRKLACATGQLLVTYWMNARESITVVSHGLPNRATLLTFARDPRGQLQTQQFILPIHSLTHHLSEKELEYLRRNPPLQLVRYISTAQRLFALQAPIEGHNTTDNYWWDLLYHKWMDPVMALIACYELLRRGAAEEKREIMQEVLVNMRKYFPGIADTEIIAALIGEKNSPPQTPPMLLDGLVGVKDRDILPLPEQKLEFGGIWTSWRNAVLPTS
jgi:Caspase domain